VKGEQGKLGASRSKSIEARKATILEEYKQLDKSNTFLDRRFGEHDKSLDEEDKMLRRFQKERQVRSRKGEKFNLEDNSLKLTHLGHSLDDADELPDPRIAQEFDVGGDLDAELVSAFNFGGGRDSEVRLSQVGDKRPLAEGETDQSDPSQERKKTKKEVMEEIIAKSKLFKAERAREKEEDEQLVEQLDEEFQSMRKELSFAKEPQPIKGVPARSSTGPVVPLKPKQDDDYERLVRQLGLDIRARPSDKLKSPEEVARMEKERLERLERARLQRMQPDYNVNIGSRELEEQDPDVTTGGYKARRLKRKMLEEDDLKSGEDGLLDEEGEEEEDDDEDEEGDEDEDGEDEEEEEEEANGLLELEAEEGEEEDDEDEDENEDEDEDENEEAEEEEEPVNEDLEGWETKEVEERKDLIEKVQKASKKKKEEEEKNEEEYVFKEPPAALKTKEGGKEQTTVKAAPAPVLKEDLPYVFPCPQSLDDLKGLLSGRSIQDQSTIITRILACHRVVLSPENRGKLQTFYDVLLKYFKELCEEHTLRPDAINSLSERIWEVSQELPETAATCSLKLLKEMERDLDKSIRSQHDDAPIEEDEDGDSSTAFWPSVHVLMALKLFSVIFPTSDFQHPIITPTFVFIGRFLSQFKMSSSTSARRVISGLFMAQVMNQYATAGKRYCPEVLVFAYACLKPFLHSLKEDPVDPAENPLFSSSVTTGDVLKVQDVENLLNLKPAPSVSFSCLDPKSESHQSDYFESDQCRTDVISSVYKLLSEACSQCSTSIKAACPEIFSPFIDLLKKYNSCLNLLPEPLREAHSTLLEKLSQWKMDQEQIRAPLALQTRKPAPIKSYNPRFDEKFVHTLRPSEPDLQRAEQQKLKRKFKQERKGAIRELRKDAAFLTAQRQTHMQTEDAHRRAKLREFNSFIQQQSSDAKSDRKKKPKAL